MQRAAPSATLGVLICMSQVPPVAEMYEPGPSSCSHLCGFSLRGLWAATGGNVQHVGCACSCSIDRTFFFSWLNGLCQAVASASRKLHNPHVVSMGYLMLGQVQPTAHWSTGPALDASAAVFGLMHTWLTAALSCSTATAHESHPLWYPLN